MAKTKLKKRTLKNLLAAMGLVFISSLPYIHDMITFRDGNIKGWVPDFGLQEWLTGADGTILGFSTYRVFIYTLLIHLFAHIGWLGWMLDAKGKSYRFFLLVPVILSAYTVALLLLNARATDFNQADVKLYITLAISIVLIFNFFINHKPEKKDDENV